MFVIAPIYNAGLESEERPLNLDHIEEVYPHVNVPVDPGAVDTESCEARFYSGSTVVILLPLATMQERLVAIYGTISNIGILE